MPAPRILSVGQCGFDHGSISRFLSSTFQADVLAADTHAHALDALRRGPIDLVLVNRVADADGSEGIELIRAMQSDPKLASVPIILVSNLPDAQDEAVAAGAVPGFGKSDLSGSTARERIEAALGTAG
jgi:two-component system chemotaxis response regulator CheY